MIGYAVKFLIYLLCALPARAQFESLFNETDLPLDKVMKALEKCGSQGSSSCSLPKTPSPSVAPPAAARQPTVQTPPARPHIPATPVATLADPCGTDPIFTRVRNQLRPGDSWHWQINGGGVPTEARGAKMIDLDLENTTLKNNCSLRKQGATVICYISATSWEANRADSSALLHATGCQINPKTKKMEPLTGGFCVKMAGWPEYYVDVRKPAVVDIMKNRIKLAQQKGCDGVEFDNMDIGEDEGAQAHGLKIEDGKRFIRELSAETRRLGMKVACKNSPRSIGSLHNACDMVVVEECYEQGKCDLYKSYPENGKPVFIAEYKGIDRNTCSDAQNKGFTLGNFTKALDGSHQRCTHESHPK